MEKGNSLSVHKLNSKHWGNIYDPKMGQKVFLAVRKGCLTAVSQLEGVQGFPLSRSDKDLANSFEK